MTNPTFDNQFTSSLETDPETKIFPRQVEGAFWSNTPPTPVSNPTTLLWNDDLAKEIGLDQLDESLRAKVFGGNEQLEGMATYAACYGGHQFGNWAGQLGDGRAIGLGEVVGANKQRYELQLKGAGATPYSRTADGRAVLRSSIREYLCAEAMYYLGIPTTRSLSLVLTGDEVVRDMFYDGNARPEPGAIVCRVAPSFIRFGSFEIFAARGDKPNLEKLIDFTIKRDFPSIDSRSDSRIVDLFTAVCKSTAFLISEWMRVGFVHGVMNTDNMSILGQTIDYGPYGWLDQYEPNWTPNTTDQPGRRYCFQNQPSVAHWNLTALANALALATQNHDGLRAGLDLYASTFAETFETMKHAKFGFSNQSSESSAIVKQGYDLLEKFGIDMTLFFSSLATAGSRTSDAQAIAEFIYQDTLSANDKNEIEGWLDSYVKYSSTLPREKRLELLHSTNPKIILRNFLAQEVIEDAEKGDYSKLEALDLAFRTPYENNALTAPLIKKRPEWALSKPGCSQLSCSS